MSTPIEAIVSKHLAGVPLGGVHNAEVEAALVKDLHDHFSEIFGRNGVDVTKTGMYSKLFLNDQRRHAVMMLVSPPVALKDASMDQIESVIMGKYYRRENDDTACQLLKGIAVEIYRSYSAAPLDATATETASQVLAEHAKQMRKG